MGAIIDFFTGLVNTISAVIDFVISFFQDLVYVIGMLGSLLLELPSYFTWLPSACITLVITTFSIVVIYKVLGRTD